MIVIQRRRILKIEDNSLDLLDYFVKSRYVGMSVMVIMFAQPHVAKQVASSQTFANMVDLELGTAQLELFVRTINICGSCAGGCKLQRPSIFATYAIIICRGA